MHYHLGLICTHCLDFFPTSSDTMQQHALVCKSMAAGDSNGDREQSPLDYEGDDDRDDDFEFGFDEDYTNPSSPHHIPSLPASLSCLVSMPGQAFLAKALQQFKLSFISAVPVPTHYSLNSSTQWGTLHPSILS